MSSKSSIRDTATDIATTTNNLNVRVEALSSINDVAGHYTPLGALHLIQLIYSIHSAFDNIIQNRKLSTTFQMLTNVGFQYSLTFYRILRSKGAFGLNRTLTKKVLNSLCFGAQQPNANSLGLLMWYLPTGQKPILCEVVNPWDDDARQTAQLVLDWDGWKNLVEGSTQLTNYLKFQNKQLKEGAATIPEPLIWEAILKKSNKKGWELKWGPQLSDEMATWKAERKSNATEQGTWYKQLIQGKKIRETPFQLPVPLTQYLGLGSGATFLNPNANRWMREGSPDEVFDLDTNPITIQQLTDYNWDDDNVFSGIGREIILNDTDQLNSCILIPSINKPGVNQYNEEDLFDFNIAVPPVWPDDIFWDGSALDQMPPVPPAHQLVKADGTTKNWKGIFDTCMRDAYKVLGNPNAQNTVPYYYLDNQENKNPTPGKESQGLVCAICAGITPPGKKKDWVQELKSQTQTWDVDHIANLIFNELFDMNDPKRPGSGFLNTCSTCNQQFKSEKIWSPSWNLWDALINKASENKAPAYAGDLRNTYPWPGLSAPGIIQNGIPPFEGYRVYMTQAYYTDGNQVRASAEYSKYGTFNDVATVKTGVKVGKTLQQANGIDFVNRQTPAMRPLESGKIQIHPYQLEAIILNRFFIIMKTTTLGQAVITDENLQPHTGKDKITSKYSNLINIYPLTAALIEAVKEQQRLAASGTVYSATQEQRDELLSVGSTPPIPALEGTFGAAATAVANSSSKGTVFPITPPPSSRQRITGSAMNRAIFKKNMSRNLAAATSLLQSQRAPGGLTNSPLLITSRVPVQYQYPTILGNLAGQLNLDAPYLLTNDQLREEAISILSQSAEWTVSLRTIVRDQDDVWNRELKTNYEWRKALEAELETAKAGKDIVGNPYHSPDGKAIGRLKKNIQLARRREANAQTFVNFGSYLTQLFAERSRGVCGIVDGRQHQVVTSIGGNANSLDIEIDALRYWYTRYHHTGNALTDDANDTDNPMSNENTRNGDIHWWTGNLMLRALQTFCPTTRWNAVTHDTGQVTEIWAGPDNDKNNATILIYHSGGRFDGHWSIKIRPSALCNLPVDPDGFYNIPTIQSGDGVDAMPTEFAHHRNGGDCGPAAVALAIRAATANGLPRLCGALMEAHQANLVRLEKLKSKASNKASQFNEKKKLLREEVRRLTNEKVIDFSDHFELTGQIDAATSIHKLEEVEERIASTATSAPTKQRGKDRPTTKRGRGGGKRTKKRRRRRKKKTRRKRKYRKKTKGRKRRRKKRTRRK